MSDPGRRDKLITIQQPTYTTAATGQRIETWAYVAKAWAKIRPIGSREAMQAQQAQDNRSHEIEIPYRPGITTRHRALYGDRVFNFTSVVNVDEANTTLLIGATEA